MRQSYDLFNGGMAQLEKDLIEWEKTLLQVNNEFVRDCGNVTKENVINRANWAEEQDTVDDIKNKTDVTFRNSKKVSYAYVVTSSPKAQFAEFGYGILGKGTYQHNEFIQGFTDYDIDTIYKRGNNRHWWFKDRSGQLHSSRGANAKHIYFYSAQDTLKQSSNILLRYKGRLGLK